MTTKNREYPVRWITDQLAVGYAPRSHDHLEIIRSQGITAIVNLCAECYDLHHTEKDAGRDSFFKKWEAMLDFFD